MRLKQVHTELWRAIDNVSVITVLGKTRNAKACLNLGNNYLSEGLQRISPETAAVQWPAVHPGASPSKLG